MISGHNLQGKSFLTLADFNRADMETIINFALKLKEKQRAGVPHRLLEGKTLAMIFQKPSTRTRVSFEAGIYQLGGYALCLNSGELQMGRGEPVEDTAGVLSRYVDGIMIRTFEHSMVEELARHATVPVINGLTDLYHPCQALADLMTIVEHRKKTEGVRVAYFGDGNNVAHSLMLGTAIMGMEMVVCTPREYAPRAEVMDKALSLAGLSDGSVTHTTDPAIAAAGSDVIYTDVWASMGQEDEAARRRAEFASYQVNDALLAKAAGDAIVMHCMPVYRGEEITAAVMDAYASVILEQAENRLHVQKALMALIM